MHSNGVFIPSYFLGVYPSELFRNHDVRTVEEAEVEAREGIMWRHLSSQIVSAVMHDAVRK